MWIIIFWIFFVFLLKIMMMMMMMIIGLFKAENNANQMNSVVRIADAFRWEIVVIPFVIVLPIVRMNLIVMNIIQKLMVRRYWCLANNVGFTFND